MIRHPSPGVRCDALSGIRSLLRRFPTECDASLGVLFDRATHLVVDEEPTVRSAFATLLRELLPLAGARRLRPFAHLLVARVCSALAHIRDGVRADGLMLVDILLDALPDMPPVHVQQLFVILRDLFVAQRAKVCGIVFRLAPLSRLQRLLELFVAGNGSTVMLRDSVSAPGTALLKSGRCAADAWENAPLGSPSHDDVGELAMRTGGAGMHDAMGVRANLRVLLPALLDCWLECIVPGTPPTADRLACAQLVLATVDTLWARLETLVELAHGNAVYGATMPDAGIVGDPQLSEQLSNLQRYLLACFPIERIAVGHASAPGMRDAGPSVAARHSAACYADGLLRINLLMCSVMLRCLRDALRAADRGDVTGAAQRPQSCASLPPAWLTARTQLLLDFVVNTLRNTARSRSLHNPLEQRILLAVVRGLLRIVSSAQRQDLLDALCDMSGHPGCPAPTRHAVLSFLSSFYFVESMSASGLHAPDSYVCAQRWILGLVASLRSELSSGAPDTNTVAVAVRVFADYLRRMPEHVMVAGGEDGRLRIRQWLSDSILSGSLAAMPTTLQCSVLELIPSLGPLQDPLAAALAACCHLDRPSCLNPTEQCYMLELASHSARVARECDADYGAYLSLLLSALAGYSRVRLDTIGSPDAAWPSAASTGAAAPPATEASAWPPRWLAPGLLGDGHAADAWSPACFAAEHVMWQGRSRVIVHAARAIGSLPLVPRALAQQACALVATCVGRRAPLDARLGLLGGAAALVKHTTLPSAVADAIAAALADVIVCVSALRDATEAAAGLVLTLANWVCDRWLPHAGVVDAQLCRAAAALASPDCDRHTADAALRVALELVRRRTTDGERWLTAIVSHGRPLVAEGRCSSDLWHRLAAEVAAQ